MNLRNQTTTPKVLEEPKFPWLRLYNLCDCGQKSIFLVTEYYIGGCPLNCNGMHRCTDQHLVVEYHCPGCDKDITVEVFSD